MEEQSDGEQIPGNAAKAVTSPANKIKGDLKK